MKSAYRVTSDSMGKMKVPSGAYYGAQTARAIENFPISNLRFSRAFIKALGLIKKYSAATNAKLELLPNKIAQAIQKASDEVINGKLDTQFVVDVFQTGSGTSTNMNANEIIGIRALKILGRPIGDKLIHPNDHVNMGQSSNDVIPSAIQLSAAMEIYGRLLPSLKYLQTELAKKAKQFKKIKKIGRTHLQDAVPMTLGQEFSGYANQIEKNIKRLASAVAEFGELPLGGTAVGTGINTHPKFPKLTIAALARETKLKLSEAKNHFSAQASIDPIVSASGALRTTAVSLIKIANDIRWLASGPRAGLGELILPATQPGSSIMPGKVNPVMCEMVIQVGAQVIGNDATISFGGTQGFFELNTMLPVVGYNLLQSIELLTNASQVFAKRCIKGLKANKKVCERNIENSLAMATYLVPAIGYDAAAKIAKVASETDKTIREVAIDMLGLGKTQINKLLKY